MRRLSLTCATAPAAAKRAMRSSRVASPSAVVRRRVAILDQ
jgi:hypothetical protein